MSTKITKRGDTIVEVLFAVAVFGFIAAATLSAMQGGMSAAQTSLEGLIVRNHLNAQAEAVRFINATVHSREREADSGTSDYLVLWEDIKDNYVSDKVSDFSGMIKDGRCIKPKDGNGKAFIIDTKNMRLSSAVDLATVYSRPVYKNTEIDSNKITSESSEFLKSEGLWIEVAKVDYGKNYLYDAYDFHIRACWDSVGSKQPITMGTIVRVYEVNNERK